MAGRGALGGGTFGCSGGNGDPGGYGGPGRGADSIGIAYLDEDGLDEDGLTLEGVTFELGPPGKWGISWNHGGSMFSAEDGVAVDTLHFSEDARDAGGNGAFLRVIAECGDNVGSAIARLLRLLDAVGAVELEEAFVEVLERDTVHVGAVRQVIDRRRSERRLPPPVSILVTRGEPADLVVTPHSPSTYDALKKDSTP